MRHLTAATVIFISLLFYTVAFAQTITGKVNANANLRAGAGTDYEIVGRVRKGQTVVIIGKNDAGDWYQLEDDQWIAARLITIDTASPTQTPNQHPTPTETPHPAPTATNCDPSYPDVCIPPAPPDLDCTDVSYRGFRVLPPDSHRFDTNKDGIGCPIETKSTPRICRA